MHSEHHWLDEIFLKDLMFDDFKAKSWSDAKENAECDEGCYSFAADEDSARETAIDFVNFWNDTYYADYGFDHGLLTFEIEKWGDDGPDAIYYEAEIKRNRKPYQTLYIALFKRVDGEWGIFEVQANEQNRGSFGGIAAGRI